MPSPFVVILNPASSGGKAGRLLRTVETTLSAEGVAFDMEITRGPGHATELAEEAVDAGREMIVAVGGDGTIHEIAQGLLGPAPEKEPPSTRALPSLAVVPVGTGNDFFRMVGAPRKPRKALEVALRGRCAHFDVGLARWDGGWSYFVNLLGVGVDVEVLRRRKRFKRLPGLPQYLAALIAAVLRFQPFPVRVRLEGLDEIRATMHLAAVTVGPSAGGGFLLNPGATPDDGLLDFCLVEALSYPEIARYIPRVIRGTHADLDVVELRRFQRGRIDRPSGEPFRFQLDGELMTDPVKGIDIDVIPRCLPVRVPGGPENGSGRGRERREQGGEEDPAARPAKGRGAAPKRGREA